jgi:uncharacterized protein
MKPSPLYTLNQYGLREKDMQFLQQAFERVSGLEQAVLYGSRARGTHRLGSDIDLALKGKTLTLRDILRFQANCDEHSPSLLRVDVVQYDTLGGVGSAALRASIDRDGGVVVFDCFLPIIS